MNNGVVTTLQIVLGLHFKPIISHHKLSFNWYLPMGDAYLHGLPRVTTTMHHKVHPKSNPEINPKVHLTSTQLLFPSHDLENPLAT